MPLDVISAYVSILRLRLILLMLIAAIFMLMPYLRILRSYATLIVAAFAMSSRLFIVVCSSLIFFRFDVADYAIGKPLYAITICRLHTPCVRHIFFMPLPLVYVRRYHAAIR